MVVGRRAWRGPVGPHYKPPPPCAPLGAHRARLSRHRSWFWRRLDRSRALSPARRATHPNRCMPPWAALGRNAGSVVGWRSASSRFGAALRGLTANACDFGTGLVPEFFIASFRPSGSFPKVISPCPDVRLHIVYALRHPVSFPCYARDGGHFLKLRQVMNCICRQYREEAPRSIVDAAAFQGQTLVAVTCCQPAPSPQRMLQY